MLTARATQAVQRDAEAGPLSVSDASDRVVLEQSEVESESVVKYVISDLVCTVGNAFPVWSNVVLDRAWRSRTWAEYHLRQDQTILPFKRKPTPTHRPSSWFLATLCY